MITDLHLVSHSPNDTRAIGRVIGESALPGNVILLIGPLGAGKTCLTQGIAWGLGISEYTRSPTFVIMTQYKGRLSLFHIDLFRIDSNMEVQDLGIDEYINSTGVCVVEWADRAIEFFPQKSMLIEMDYGVKNSDRFIRIKNGIQECENLTQNLQPFCESEAL